MFQWLFEFQDILVEIRVIIRLVFSECGAKPVLVPVGQSTETQVVPTITKQMTLDITMDDFANQRAQLIQDLAAQYGVDPSLVALGS